MNSSTEHEAAHISFIPDEDFVGAMFRPTTAIRSLHNIPRFGFPSDVSLVASDTEEERLQYLYGTTFLSLTVLLVFAVWTIYLVFCKFIGAYRAGILSGSIPLMPFPEHMEEDTGSENQPLNMNDEEIKPEGHVHHNHDRTTTEEIQEWDLEYRTLEHHVGRARIFFFGCGLIVLAASFGIYVSGLSSLQKGFLNAKNEIVTLRGAIDAASQQLRIQFVESRKFVPRGESAYEHAEAWCPNVETNFTLDVESVKDHVYNFSKYEGGILFNVSTMRNGFMEMYSTLGDMIADSSLTVVDALKIASSNAQDEIDFMEKYIWWYGLSFFFLFSVDVLTIVCMLGVYMASKTDQSLCLEKVLSWVVFPIFSFTTVVCWLLTAGVAVVAILTADACTGSPEKNLVAIFHEKQRTFDPVLYSLTKYYVEDCMTIPVDTSFKPTQFVENFHDFLDVTIAATNDFLLNTSAIIPDMIDQECGDSIVTLRTSMISLVTGLNELQQVTAMTENSLYCSVFTPIYTNIMHDEVCYKGMNALATIFNAMTVLTIACMLMITLRVATHTIEFYETGDHGEHDPHELALNERGAAITGL